MINRKLMIHFSKTGDFEDVDYRLKMLVRSAVLKTLEHERFPYDAELSVTFCDNGYIHALNKKYRNVDRHTDVLSFPIYDSGDFPILECISGALLGDVVISLERAKEQAKELGNSFFREVAFLTVHSTLHLLGYDHERSEEDDELQCKIQKEICEGLEF